MSYSSNVKRDLLTQTLKRCCRRALLMGILFSRATLDNSEIAIRLEGEELIQYSAQLIKEQFTQIAGVNSLKQGGNVQEVRFHARSAQQIVSDFDDGVLQGFDKCPDCNLAFLRGVFLACGRVDPPEKQYHLEFSALPSRLASLREFLETLGLFPKDSQRRGQPFLYFKDSTSIEDILTAVGASSATLSLINLKIEREFLNNANRGTNCYTANVKRAVGAAQKQIDAILRLKEKNKLSFLPPDLIETAEYRLLHQEMSLSQMAMSMTPPITKSGLNHRLTKIMEYAEALLEEKP